MRIQKIGYDFEVIWEKSELEAMYISEGKTPEQAAILADALYEATKKMASSDLYHWKKCRKHELTGYGIDGVSG